MAAIGSSSPGARSTTCPAGYGRLLTVLAALLTINTLIGPLLLGWFEYPVPDSVLNQLLGLELVTMALVVPSLVGAAALARRGHPAAALVGFGPSAYAAYMFVQYVVGPAYRSYSSAVLLHLVITTVALTATAWSWSLGSRIAPPELNDGGLRRLGVVLIALAAFVLLRYLPLLAGAASPGAIPTEFSDAPSFYWTIVLLDLAVVVPAALVAGIAALRGHPRSLQAVSSTLGWLAFVAPSVAAMAMVMLARNDPNASVGTAAIMVGVSALTVGAILHVLVPTVLRRLANVPPTEDLSPAGSGLPPLPGVPAPLIPSMQRGNTGSAPEKESSCARHSTS